MKPEELKALQAPIKAKYKQQPDAAIVTMSVTGTLSADLTCTIPTHAGSAVAGLHPAAGGDGSQACSGDMLLESLVACAGVTLQAVATAMEIPINTGTIVAEGTMDFKGTLGVSKESAIGLTNITMMFNIDSPAEDSKIAKLIELTERYCVIYQTLKNPPALETRRAGDSN
ncbi:OsmC family protein [bacterium]|nr:OsmC family protein [bacterium]